MATSYHVIKDGVIANTILAESADALPGLVLVPADAGRIGDLWNDGNPISQPAQPLPRYIRDWEFRDRFNQAEQQYVLGLAFGGNAQAQYLIFKMQTASDGVNLDSPDVAAGLDYLISLNGVITAATKARVLA